MAIAGSATTWKHATHGSPAALTDYTTKTRSVTLTNDGEEVDATVFGDSFREYEQSFKSAEITVQYKYDATIWQVIADLYTNGTSVIWELGPVGTTGGNPQIEGSMVCRTFTQPFPVGELQVLDVTFRVTGAVTFGAF